MLMNRPLIKRPNILLEIVVDGDAVTDIHCLHGERRGYSTIEIHTDRGVYKITGCANCHAVFLETEAEG